MLGSFLIVFPIFAVIALGWSAVRLRLVSQETGNGVAEFVFVIALPLMLFRALATAQLPSSPPWTFWLSYYLGLAVIWIVIARIARHAFGRGGQEAGIIGFTAGQSNMVLMGVPLVLRVLGDEASIPLFLLIAVNLPITLSVATLLIESSTPGTSKGWGILHKLATNPILIGIAAGVLFRQTGLALPDPILGTLKFIGDAAGPCALFAMGAALSRYGFGGDAKLLSIVVGLKLLVLPVLVYLLASKVFALAPLWTAVAVLLASSPCGVNAYLLAERYRLGQGLASGAIAVSTLFSVLTTTFWVWVLTMR